MSARRRSQTHITMTQPPARGISPRSPRSPRSLALETQTRGTPRAIFPNLNRTKRVVQKQFPNLNRTKSFLRPGTDAPANPKAFYPCSLEFDFCNIVMFRNGPFGNFLVVVISQCFGTDHLEKNLKKKYIYKKISKI